MKDIFFDQNDLKNLNIYFDNNNETNYFNCTKFSLYKYRYLVNR